MNTIAPIVPSPDLIDFLQDELAVSPAAIQLGMRQARNSQTLLPMALWQYGLVTMGELNQILDWLEQRPVPSYMA
ncbi:MAG: DUF2949 domain-containing protein [Leptolyngbya sp. RL_3_1]|nr:DUF2949 domain-containing protein [Leptolyngbya sp. RL_3_1]